MSSDTKPVEDTTVDEENNAEAKKNYEVDEDEILRLRVKLYRFRDKEWKERGIGDARILKHKTTGKYRVLMRREKTLKLCLNHQILPFMELRDHKNREKAYIWSTPADFSEETPSEELFAIMFRTIEDTKLWKEAWDKAREESEKLFKKKEGESTEKKEGETAEKKEGESTEKKEGESTEKKEGESAEKKEGESTEKKEEKKSE